MTKIVRPTPKEHAEFGYVLRQMRFILWEFANKYPKNSPQIRQLINLDKTIDRTRSMLDNEICQELPRDDASAVAVYYGK